MASQIELNVTAAARYENVRALCHTLREEGPGNESAVESAAQLLYPLLPETVWLIPVPSHDGTSGVALRLALRLWAKAFAGKKKSVGILTGLTGKARESLYERKKANKDISHYDLGLKTDYHLQEMVRIEKEQGVPVMLLDTVVDTGTTATAAARATGINKILCVGLTGNHSKDKSN